MPSTRSLAVTVMVPFLLIYPPCSSHPGRSRVRVPIVGVPRVTYSQGFFPPTPLHSFVSLHSPVRVPCCHRPQSVHAARSTPLSCLRFAGQHILGSDSVLPTSLSSPSQRKSPATAEQRLASSPTAKASRQSPQSHRAPSPIPGGSPGWAIPSSRTSPANLSRRCVCIAVAAQPCVCAGSGVFRWARGCAWKAPLTMVGGVMYAPSVRHAGGAGLFDCFMCRLHRRRRMHARPGRRARCSSTRPVSASPPDTYH
jgi:hypothetical protein